MTIVVLEMANNIRAKLTTTNIKVTTLELVRKLAQAPWWPDSIRIGRATSIWAVSPIIVAVAAIVAPTIEPKLWANIRAVT